MGTLQIPNPRHGKQPQQESQSWSVCHLSVSTFLTPAVDCLEGAIRTEKSSAKSRVRKRRCVPVWGDTCRLCQLLSTPCSLNSGSRQHPSPANSLVAPSKLTAKLPDEELLQNEMDLNDDFFPSQFGPSYLRILGSRELFGELVPLYFRFIHNIAHTMFHVPSFMHRLNEGNACRVHVLAMCALAAR